MTRHWPIRLRITVMAAAAGLVATAGVAAVAISRAEDEARGALDVFLSQEATEALALVSRGGTFVSLVDVTSASGPSQRVALFDLSGAMIDSTALAPPIPDVSEDGSRFETLEAPGGSELFRVLVVPFRAEEGPRVLVVASPLAFVRSRVVSAALTMIPLVVLAVTVVAVGGFVLTGLALRPVERLRASAALLASQPDGRRLEIPDTGDELASLATTLNQAIDAVDRTMVGQRQFVAEASHELRTPMAIMRAEVEFALRPTRTPAEVKHSLEEIDLQVSALVDLSDGLLELLANKHGPLGLLESISIEEFVTDLRVMLGHYLTLGIDCGGQGMEGFLRCNRRELIAAVRNVVDNAYQHGAEPVTLAIDADDQRVRFRVEDRGRGIPPELVDGMRLPFVRGPGHGGKAGLGLTIASRAVERHGGVIEISNFPGGCRVEWSLPLT